MNCSDIHNFSPIDCQPDMNQMLINSRIYLKGNAKKAMKLLAKQYDVISVEMNPRRFQGDHQTQDAPCLLRYRERKNRGKVFEWILEPQDFEFHDGRK